MAVALLGFAALCVLVLTKASQMLEPDDYAYRASIVALSHGEVLLSTAQYQALSRLLGEGGNGIVQWIHLPDGRWISEKNPGYPFFAVIFQILGVLRLAPLFYGGVACLSLYLGARRWLGRYGGTFAVLLFCSSGAAITFAWRATMPSFTDASLVAAGAGALLWAMLAFDASRRRRLLVGIAAFLCFEGATFIRYTDIVELIVAALVAVVLFRRVRLPWQTIAWWMVTVAVFGAGVAVFDTVVYGAPLRTGYGAGEITFSLSAVWPNLENMPIRLFDAMPMVLPALVAIGWIVVRLVHDRDGVTGRPTRFEHRRDGTVASALVVGWAGIWGLYLAYTWTVNQVGADPVHVIRFYLPAIGLIALLGAWTLVKVPRVVSLSAVAVALVFGVMSFHGMAAMSAAGPGGFGPGGAGPGGLRPGGFTPGRGGPPPGGPGSGGPP